MSILDQLASFMQETSWLNIPAKVKEQAKVRVIDLLSACGFGLRSGVRNPLPSLDIIQPSHPQATIFFSPRQSYPPLAAACNTFTANSSGMEDGSRFAGAHPSSGIIPAALAAAEMTGASGSELIVAVVVAYEVYLRVGYALYPTDLKRGFQPSAILAPIGAAAAVGKLLNLDPPRLRSSLSLACLSASGLKVAFEAYASKCYQIARGVKGGLEAALLAKEGLQGPGRALEEGFLKAYGSEESSINLTDLGSRFSLPQTYLKIHGGCRLIHPCIDAALDLKEKERIAPEQVEKISIKITSVAHEMENEDPKNALDARFSTPFLVAAALKEGEVSEHQITGELMRDKIMKSLLAKIRVEVDPELDRNYPAQRGAEVSIQLCGGKTVSRRVDFALGEPENPLSLEQIKEKFQNSMKGFLPAREIGSLYQLLETLEEQEKMSPLFNFLRRWVNAG